MGDKISRDSKLAANHHRLSLDIALHFLRARWLLLAAMLIQGVLFSSAWKSFYKTWSTQDFSHGVVIIPISIFLAWRMRGRLMQYTIAPSYVWLLGLLVGAFIWSAGHITATASVMQLGAILAAIFTILSFVGSQVGRVVWFPLFYLLLILPFGGWLGPYLTTWTADALHMGLLWLGIPVFREGEEFVLPTGRWSVISACSGIRFIFSAVVLGFLFGHLNFRKFKATIIFVIVAVVASIGANWVRALITVLTGHATNMRFGPGEEHLWLGWVVFGLVMWTLFWIASRWADVTPEPTISSFSPNFEATSRSKGTLTVVALTILICVAFSSLARTLVREASESTLSAFSNFRVLGSSELDKLTYEPKFVGWSAIKRGKFQATQSQFLVAYFEGQANTASMLGLVNQVIPDDEKSEWKMRNLQSRNIGGLGFPVREFVATSANVSVVVQYWYTVGGIHTISPVRTKFLTLKNVILGQGDGAVLNLVVHKSNPSTSDLHQAELIKDIAIATSSFTRGQR